MGEVFTKSFEVCVPSINTHHLNVFFLFRRQTTEKSIQTRSFLTLLKPEDFSGAAIYHACYELLITPQIFLIYNQGSSAVHANWADFIKEGENVLICS